MAHIPLAPVGPCLEEISREAGPDTSLVEGNPAEAPPLTPATPPPLKPCPSPPTPIPHLQPLPLFEAWLITKAPLLTDKTAPSWQKPRPLPNAGAPPITTPWPPTPFPLTPSTLVSCPRLLSPTLSCAWCLTPSLPHLG